MELNRRLKDAIIDLAGQGHPLPRLRWSGQEACVR
jgi:hypothetical protein